GGFRVGQNPKSPDSEHAVRVSKLLEATATYYAGLSANTNDPAKADSYLRMAKDVIAARDLYQRTTLNYWRGAKSTPADVVGPKGTGGNGILGPDGNPLRRAAGQ